LNQSNVDAAMKVFGEWNKGWGFYLRSSRSGIRCAMHIIYMHRTITSRDFGALQYATLWCTLPNR